ncbi:hypothetical protein [Bacillus sp. FJAT-29937]|uniref:hypothetical protein n=1 Tax=Bacillus sp. FJAT-29937 TaxID=1720553 RepID=UPI0008337A80|nr:hypothetical protein [Bacillus sp. FJAT-29937]
MYRRLPDPIQADLRSFYARKKAGEKARKSMRKQEATGIRNEKGRRKSRSKRNGRKAAMVKF